MNWCGGYHGVVNWLPPLPLEGQIRTAIHPEGLPTWGNGRNGNEVESIP